MRNLVDSRLRPIALGELSSVSKGLLSTVTGISDTLRDLVSTSGLLGFRAQNHWELEHRSHLIGRHRVWTHRFSGNSSTISLGFDTPTLRDLRHGTSSNHRDLMHKETANLRIVLRNPPRNSDSKNLNNYQQHKLMSFLMEKGNV